VEVVDNGARIVGCRRKGVDVCQFARRSAAQNGVVDDSSLPNDPHRRGSQCRRRACQSGRPCVSLAHPHRDRHSRHRRRPGGSRGGEPLIRQPHPATGPSCTRNRGGDPRSPAPNQHHARPPHAALSCRLGTAAINFRRDRRVGPLCASSGRVRVLRSTETKWISVWKTPQSLMPPESTARRSDCRESPSRPLSATARKCRRRPKRRVPPAPRNSFPRGGVCHAP